MAPLPDRASQTTTRAQARRKRPRHDPITRRRYEWPRQAPEFSAACRPGRRWAACYGLHFLGGPEPKDGFSAPSALTYLRVLDGLDGALQHPIRARRRDGATWRPFLS